MRGPLSRHVRWLTPVLAGLLVLGGVACDSYDDGGGGGQPGGGDQEQQEGDGGY